jgi:proteic killer suppression protein
VIASFGDQATADLYHGTRTRKARAFPNDIVAVAIRKLDMLNAVHSLLDLRSPPGNRLESLRGSWRGYHSVRVNDQWRLVFRWSEAAAHDVRLLDYHKG